MNTIRNLWMLLTTRQRWAAAALFLMMLTSMVLELVGLGLVLPALAFMTGPPTQPAPWMAEVLERWGNPSQARLIVWGLSALLVVFVVKTTFLVFTAYWQSRFVAALQTSLGTRLFSIYMMQPWTFHLQRNSSELIRNVNEINDLSAPFMAGLGVIAEVLVVLGILAFLLWVEPVGTTVIAVVLGCSVAALWLLTSKRMQRWGERRHEHRQHLNQHLQQGLGGNKDVRIRGCERYFIGRLHDHMAMVSTLWNRQLFLAQLPRLWLELWAVIAISALAFTLLWQGATSTQLIVSLGLFAAAAFRILPSANRLSSAMYMLRFYQAPVQSLRKELALPCEDDLSPRLPMPFSDSIVMEDVTYRFPETSRPALDAVTIRIAHGTSVGIIGGSGAGKSTAIDVLLGILQPNSGRVLVDGVDIRGDIRAWQRIVGYVPQTIYLCDDSLRENIAFGVHPNSIDDDAVRRAIIAAQLEDFVASLPAGLETVVGERGVRLSGGQRQRIGIARALYHDPDVLVLDEATSALDTETEAEVMAAVDSLHGSKTIVIVAHRLSTVQRCDVLYRLEQGRVVQVGSFTEVVGK